MGVIMAAGSVGAACLLIVPVAVSMILLAPKVGVVLTNTVLQAEAA